MISTKAPVSVLIVGWILTLTGGWMFLYTPFPLKSPFAQSFFQSAGVSQTAILIEGELGAILSLVAGIGILKGWDWARRLYLFLTPLLLLSIVTLYNFRFLGLHAFSIVMYVVFAVILTRRSAVTYFTPSTEAAAPLPQIPSQPLPDEPDMGKRLASVILLIFGGIFLAAWFMILMPMSKSLLGTVIVSVILAIPVIAFVTPAIFLWGRKRWAVVLGTLFVCIGGMLLMMSLMLYQLSTTDPFREQFARIDPVMTGMMIRGGLLFGIGAGIIGGLLIMLQRTNDNASAPSVDAS